MGIGQTVVIALAISMMGCFAPDYAGNFACSESGKCPLGYECLEDQNCYPEGTQLPSYDAAAIDAAIDDAEVDAAVADNDSCQAAVELQSGIAQEGTLLGATDLQTHSCESEEQPEAFYSFTLDAPSDVTITLTAATDLSLSLHAAGCASELACEGGASLGETLIAENLDAGSYVVAVESGGDGGTFTVRVDVVSTGCSGPIGDTTLQSATELIDCAGNGACQTDQTCSAGTVCLVECSGDNSCAGITIDCGAAAECQVRCSGQNSCGNTTITAPTMGMLNTQCIDLGACQNSEISCGLNADCATVCDSANACQSLAQSCSANGTCTLACTNDACNNTSQTCGSQGSCDFDCESGSCVNAVQSCGTDRCTSCDGDGAQLVGASCVGSCFCESSC